MQTIFVTGGHLTPALSVMYQLKVKGWLIYYLGRKHALEGDSAIAQEYRVVKRAGFVFLELISGRLQRKFSWRSVASLVKIPLGFLLASYYLVKYRPQVILSFGGYLALPIAICAWIGRIPILIHEQTFVPGITNRLIAKLATKICISWEETRSYFPQRKIILTGNPLRPEVFQIRQKLPVINTKKPLIYITGGNLGAHSLNLVIEKGLLELVTKYTLIHQIGNAQEFADYQRLIKLKEKLPRQLQADYYPVEYVDSDYIGWVLSQSDLIVTRAGANIVTEVIALKKLAIFVPLPWSAAGEQMANAQFLVRQQAARMIEQKDLTKERLISEIEQTLAAKKVILAYLQVLQTKLVPNASFKIVEVIESIGL